MNAILKLQGEPDMVSAIEPVHILVIIVVDGVTADLLASDE